MAKRTDERPPWKRNRPARAKKTSLTRASRAKARARARRAGRPYPNLVDNMRAATEQRARTRKTGTRKSSGGKAKPATRAGGRKKKA